MDIKITDHLIGRDHLTCFIADIATNHDGDLDCAKMLIKLAKDASPPHPISVSSSELTAKRSTNLRLSAHKLSTALGGEIPNFSTGLAKFYTQYQQGYPQKILSYQQGKQDEP